MTIRFASRLLLGAAMIGLPALSVHGAAAAGPRPVTFDVLVEDVLDQDAIRLPDGSTTFAPISPGIVVVAASGSVLFQSGKPAGSSGLESLAEDGNPAPLIASLERAGVRARPFTHDERFTVTAKPGDGLFLAAMFAQSNDLFIAPDPKGIALFDQAGQPISAISTSEFKLWDAGTEVNQSPGVGPDQAPRQSKPNTGAVEHGIVRLVNDGFTYPDLAKVIRVTITPHAPAS